MKPLFVADPYVLRDGNQYYLYAAGAENGSFTVRSSSDLINWGPARVILRADANAWSKDCYWAPECHRIGHRYCLFYSANQQGRSEAESFAIGLAVCDTPDGTFEALWNRPLFAPPYPVIDANILCEGSRIFLYYSRCCFEHLVGAYEESWIYGGELKPDLSGFLDEPKLLIRPEQPWEGRSAPTTGRRWNEGSCIIKHEGRYLMLYSANCYLESHYAMGYATATDPLGPFIKASENPIVSCTERVTGPGHGCLVAGPEGLMAVYHGRTEATGSSRVGFAATASIANERLAIDAGCAIMMLCADA